MSVGIFVVSHKAFKPPKHAIYMPLYVGSKDFDTGCCYRDDYGENIADKNPFYCELTGLYWLWKNLIDEFNVVGLCHYRRYFSKIPFLIGEDVYLKERGIYRILSEHDIILPWKSIQRWSVYENYFDHGAGREKDLILLKNVVSELYPEYITAYNSVLESNEASYCNMFVMRSENAKCYCKWLFDILFELEKRIDLKDYSKAEARIYGYMSEILLNVWVEKNGLKPKYYPIILTEQSVYQNVRGQINHYRRKC